MANKVEVRLSDEAKDNLIAKTLDLAIKQFSSQDAKAKWTVEYTNEIVRTFTESFPEKRTVGFFRTHEVTETKTITNQRAIVNVDLDEDDDGDTITVTSDGEEYDDVACWVIEQLRPFFKTAVLQINQPAKLNYAFGWTCKYCDQRNIVEQVNCMKCGASR